MTINETIEQAAQKFGVSRAALTGGHNRKYRELVRAREFVVAAYPDESLGKLGRTLGVDRSTIVNIRKRLANKIVLRNESQHSGLYPWWVK